MAMTIGDTPQVAQAARVRQWNTTAQPYPRAACLAELFARWSLRTPDAWAVIDGERRLSYRDLDQRANALAHTLVRHGVQSGQTVGVLGRRSADAIVAILGIVKAGAAYVPLDIEHPAPRLSAMVEDSDTRVIVALPGVGDVLSDVTATVLRPDGLAVDEPPVLSRAVTGEDLGYIMFTSGSTGRPKAVGVRQHGITRLVVNTNYISFVPDDRVLQVTALTFDLSTFEIWGALLNGACLIVTPPRVQLSSDDLRGLMDRHEVSVALLSTAVFHQLASQRPSLFTELGHLLVCGETLNLHLAREVLAHGPPEHFINAYGPTENTTFTTTYLVNDLPADATAIPIGTPISNTTCYILRDDASLADVGEKGELVTGGDGVAAGYLNDPDLTDERFVPDPFSDDPAARLYRTGDVASWHQDGTIAFHGRLDGQFKIRGHRVEASEIETALCGHIALAEAVIARQESTVAGDVVLIAYLVPARGHEPPGERELRDHLSVTLPAYMIPAVFIWLERLPLNPHGKVDRAALPAPPDSRAAPPDAGPSDAGPSDTGPPDTGPATDPREQVRSVWQQVLRTRGIERDIAPDETLFDVGGTSFDVPAIHGHITDLFPLPDLTPLDLFSHPTLGGYTDHLLSLLGTAGKMPGIRQPP